MGALLLGFGVPARRRKTPRRHLRRRRCKSGSPPPIAQWQAAYKRDVSDVHETELNKLKFQFLTSLEAAITKASSASDLDGAVALRNEQKRFGDTNVFPEQDEAGDAAPVKQLRTAIRAQLVRLEKERSARAKALHAKYDQFLAQAQSQLHATPAARRRAAGESQARGSRRRLACGDSGDNWLRRSPSSPSRPLPAQQSLQRPQPNQPAAIFSRTRTLRTERTAGASKLRKK